MGNLINCEDCNNQMSSEAMACPNCGKPNKLAKSKNRDQVQKGGCLLVIIGAVACVISPFIGIIAIVVGIVIILIGLVMR